MECSAGQQDTVVKVRTVLPDSGRLTGMSFVVLQLKEGLEILQRVVYRKNREKVLCCWISYHAYALSAAKLLVLVAVTL